MDISLLDQRVQKLNNWLTSIYPNEDILLTPISSDAGFRRYFRFKRQKENFVAVDAPPETELNAMFVAVSEAMSKKGISVPKVLFWEENQGFMVVSDLGDTLLSDLLTDTNYQQWYQEAAKLIPSYQDIEHTTLGPLPQYNQELIFKELEIFSEWFVDAYLGLPLNDNFLKHFGSLQHHLTHIFLSQPQVAVHRDYHCRNIMLTAQKLALIDFQTLVTGPVAYDLVSLLRDCYQQWPSQWVEDFSEQWRQEHYPSISSQQFKIWFDLTGLQRHLKAVGIFARLKLRDGKDGYLQDIPRTLDYVKTISAKYSQTLFLHDFISKHVEPALVGMSDE